MASLASILSPTMKPLFRPLVILLGLSLLGMSHKAPVTVRFYVEANAHDTDHFATPIQLLHPPKTTFIEKIPTVNERMILAIYPFQAADGTFGCSFKLDQSGRLDLEVASTGHRGGSIVAFLSTKSGTHQVVDMLIDRPVTDGIITIPFGLTEAEVEVLTKEFPIVGQKKKRK
jgi:hypothetical protein